MIFEILILVVATWVSFVKSSIQACLGFFFILLLSTFLEPRISFFSLGISALFLLVTSLLIPKPNPRHQKRRFQLFKALDICLFGVLGFYIHREFHPDSIVPITSLEQLQLDWLLSIGAINVLIIGLLFTRKHHVA